MDGQSILEQIHAAYYQLTAAERKVADYVLTQYADVQFMSITQLAEECGVAEATISRFCRSMNLKGFNAFKMELARHSVSSAVSPKSLSEPDTDTFEGRCRQAGQLAIDAVSQTLELLREDTVNAAVDLLDRAGRVLCIGNGGSLITAGECSNHFATISNKFYALPDSHLQLAAIATMSRDDVILLFSYSGATINSLEVLELAKSRGVRTILITRFLKSPAAKLADVVLRCGSNEGPFQPGSTPAKMAQLVLIDVLYQEFYHRHPAESERNIEDIAAALACKHI